MDYTPGRFHPTVTRPELKFRARMALTGRWGSAVLAMIVYLLLAMGCGMIPIIGTILLVPPLEFGLYIVFLKFYRENDTRLENLFSGSICLARSLPYTGFQHYMFSCGHFSLLYRESWHPTAIHRQC